MTLDALRLEVPDLTEDDSSFLSELTECLAKARANPQEQGLQEVLSLLFRANRCNLTLLERQRCLQSLTTEYQHHARTFLANKLPSALFIRLCSEMASGFKRLLLQILQSRHPSRPHLAWCLYMAQYFLGQCLLRHYQLYQEPPPYLWRDSHLLYWIGEHQQCLDEHIAAAFEPLPANTLRGLYQQVLLLALSNPFHLAEQDSFHLFSALAPIADLARLQAWDDEDECDGPIVDLGESQPCLPQDQQVDSDPLYLRRFELGALLVALHEPAPLQTAKQRELLQQVRPHWLGRLHRRHDRTESSSQCNIISSLSDIHAQLLGQHPTQDGAQILDASAGGARLLCNSDQGKHVPVGQLLLVLSGNGTSMLALVRWRHQNSEGLHLGLRYLKGLPRPVWLRRAPGTQAHPAVMQSTPAPGNGWHHGLWLPIEQFSEGENLWLQLASVNSQTMVPLPAANLMTASVSRHALRIA